MWECAYVHRFKLTVAIGVPFHHVHLDLDISVLSVLYDRIGWRRWQEWWRNENCEKWAWICRNNNETVFIFDKKHNNRYYVAIRSPDIYPFFPHSIENPLECPLGKFILNSDANWPTSSIKSVWNNESPEWQSAKPSTRFRHFEKKRFWLYLANDLWPFIKPIRHSIKLK